MRKIIWAMLVLLLVNAFPASAGVVKYLKFEEAAIAASRKWRETGTAQPMLSDDGRVLYPYGQYQPVVVCSLLRVCDIALQPGEVILSKPSAGDKMPWDITQSFSGEGDNKIAHIVLKAKQADIETNLIVRTNRRTYSFTIKGTKIERDYMGMIGFYYPEEIVESWEKAAQEELDKRKKGVVSLPPGGVDKLDYNYEIEGEAPWKPLRVFNDGVKTYVDFPKSIETGEMPPLVIQTDESDDLIDNQRMKSSTRLEVDQLFEKAALVLGSNKVTIRWKNAASGNSRTSWSAWWP